MSVARIDAELTKMLYAQARSGILGGLAITVLVPLFLRNAVPHIALIVWVVPMLLVNLVGNAIKFTDVGSVAVGVGMQDESDTRTSVRFSVRDTGVGIVPAPRKAH